MKNCSARQYSDQMQCSRCGLTWDVNDPDPPQCLRPEDRRKAIGNAALKKLKEDLSFR